MISLWRHCVLVLILVVTLVKSIITLNTILTLVANMRCRVHLLPII